MSHRNKNVVRFEKRATNHIGLFFVFLLTIGLIVGGGFLLYKYRDKIDWNLTLPWESSSSGGKEKEESGKKGTNKELTPPQLKNDNKISKGNSTFEITKISTDDKGFVITAVYTSKSRTSTMDVTQVVIDGFHTTTTFKVEDTYDVNDPTTKPGKEFKFRIYSTDLNKYNLTTFSSLTFHYTIYEYSETFSNCVTKLNFNSYVKTNDGLKGLSDVGSSANVKIQYYKTEEFLEETYIYFFADNKDVSSKEEIKIKKLIINDRVYEMPEFSEVLPKGSGILFYIKIPSKKIKNVENFTVSFYILKHNIAEDAYTDIYITNDYTKEL